APAAQQAVSPIRISSFFRFMERTSIEIFQSDRRRTVFSRRHHITTGVRKSRAIFCFAAG
ncbi:hypothetical protein, partial [Pyramidobacter piscolens]